MDGGCRRGRPRGERDPAAQAARHVQYMHASAWSPLWWLDDGSAFLATLRRDTDRAWTSAVAVARVRAEAAMTAWSQMELQYGSYVPAAASSAAARWSCAARCGHDARGHRCAGDRVDGRRSRSRGGRRLSMRSQVATGGYGGVPALLAVANHTVSVARGDNLDTGAGTVTDRDAHATSTTPATTVTGDQVAGDGTVPLNALISPRRPGRRPAARTRRDGSRSHGAQRAADAAGFASQTTRRCREAA